MRKFLAIVCILAGVGMMLYWLKGNENLSMLNPKGIKKIVDNRKYERYDFDSLRKRGGIASEIRFGIISEGVKIRRENELINKYGKRNWKKYDVRDFDTKTIIYESNGKKISGMINYFNDGEKRPVIIMVRGYADSEGYYVGSGSWKMADKLAENGFVTVSLDFLGFGESDYESKDILEARFEKVASLLDLIESVKKLSFVDQSRIGIWAHSNGGQIVLSVLEITGGNYPTSLWAPMTNPFPKSVLDTIGDDEAGKIVKKAITDFEKQYDSRRYAFENYYSWINTPIVIHQGTGDEWCEMEWQEEVRDKLKELGKTVTLNIYKGDDHNLKKNWEIVTDYDIRFFKGLFNKN